MALLYDFRLLLTYPIMLLLLLLIRWLIRWLSITNMILCYYCLTRFPGQFFNFRKRFFIQCVACQRHIRSSFCNNFVQRTFFSFYMMCERGKRILDEKLQFIATYLVIIMHVTRALTSEKCLQIKSIFSHKLIKISQRQFVINAMPCTGIMVKNTCTFLSFSVHVQWKFRTATFAHSNKFFMLSRIFLMTFSHLDGM